MKRKNMLVMCLAVAGTLLLLFAGSRAFRYYRQSFALRQARKFAALGDYRNASLSARRLLALNPASIEGCRMLGELAEAFEPREALEWYQRVAKLQPTIENKLELTAKALRLQPPPYELAAQTLDQLAGLATNRVSYCVLAAEFSLRLGKASEAEQHFEAARRLQPTNELHELNIAMLRLNSTNIAVAGAARATLDRFRTSKTFSALVLRSLVAEALAHNDLKTSENLSGELVANSDALLEDRLQHLEILREAGSSEAQSFFGSIQKRAVTNAAEMSAVMSWMAKHDRVKESMIWLTNAPSLVRDDPSVRLVTVETLFSLRDWAAAEKLLNERKWGELESMRLGLLAHAAAEQHEMLAAELQWHVAIKQARKRLGSLVWLASKADEWGCESFKEQALWQIAVQFPNQGWALVGLANAAQAGGRTRDLHRVYSVMANSNPSNPVIQNNFAATGLLLRIDLEKSYETASVLFAQSPTEPIIASTYAYSLHLQNRTADGLSALEKLSDENLKNPPIALYYGLLLRADGQTERAGKYLKLAESASLLPEERELLERGMKGL